MPRPLDTQLPVWTIKHLPTPTGGTTPLLLLGRGSNYVSPYIPALMMASPCNMSSQLICEGSAYLRELDIVNRVRKAKPSSQARPAHALRHAQLRPITPPEHVPRQRH